MKKVLFAFASAILALTSCSNESEIQSLPNAGEEAMATIRVGMAPKTRATIDNDGAAAHVNRCILEVRTGDSKRVYRHVETKVDPATLTATFQVPLVISQTYDFLFWADNANLDASLQKFSDKYYDTQDLTAVKIKDETTGNLDAKDAFFAAGLNVEFTGTVLTPMEYTLTRPFAQVNIVTNDLLEIKAANDPDLAADELWPATISVNYTTEFPTQFNVSTGEASVTKVINRRAEAVYGCAEAKAYNTLNMDYIFVNEVEGEGTTPFAITKAEITSKNDKVITILKGETNIPLKRNYRTNIIGSFLTDPQDFKVTVNPIWYEPDYNPLPAPPSPTGAQGCTVVEDPETGEVVATYTPGSSVVVIPEGVTKFDLNEGSEGGVYNMTVESLTIPNSIAANGRDFGEDFVTGCKNLSEITANVTGTDFTLYQSFLVFTSENVMSEETPLIFNIIGIPNSFHMKKHNGTLTDQLLVQTGSSSGAYVHIMLPAGWRAAGLPYLFINEDSNVVETYEDGVLIARNGVAVN